MNRHREEVRAGYRIVADTYHAGRLAREAVNVEWLDSMSDLLPTSGKVVDLGCGTGVPITRYFANRGFEVAGFDISEEMLVIARREVLNASFTYAPIEELSFEPGSLDLVVSFFALIHIERSVHAQLFAQIFEWLRPGGAALLSLGADDSEEWRDDNWHGAPMVWSHFDAQMNLALLREAGFDIAWSEVEDFGNERHLFVIAHKPS